MVLDRAGMVASKIRCRWNRTMPGNYIKVPLVIVGIDRAWTRNLVQEKKKKLGDTMSRPSNIRLQEDN